MQTRFIHWLFRCLLWMVLCTPVMAAETVVVEEARTYYLPLEGYIAAGTAPVEDKLWIPGAEELVPRPPGQPQTGIWYRVDLPNRTDQEHWHLLITNTLLHQVRVYSISAAGEYQASRGFERRYPFDLTNGVPVVLTPGTTTSLWIQLQSPYISHQPLLRIMPDTEYWHYQFQHSSLVMLAVGAMLALVLYNIFLYFPTRDISFLWYASYQLLCTFAWATHFKLILYGFGLKPDASTLLLPFFIAGASSLMFAISFLRLPPGGWIALLVRALAISLVIFGMVGLLLPMAQYQAVMLACTGIWMFIMLGLGIWRFNKGYRPARIYILGFGVVTSYFLFAVAGDMAGTSLFDNLLVWALWAQLFDAVALALALADRINFLRKSRQHADKRASTDQLTGLPNRTAFERDIRAWEVYYREGIIQEFFLTFIDVDGLKKVNDRMGHTEGDRLLSLVAQWLSRQCQQQNVYRVGGDEFVILARHQIQWDLSSLHQLLGEEGFPHADLSMGTSSYSESGNRSALLQLADERMYAIKHSGR